MTIQIEVKNDAGEPVFSETIGGVTGLISPGYATPGMRTVALAILRAVPQSDLKAALDEAVISAISIRDFADAVATILDMNPAGTESERYDEVASALARWKARL